MNKRATKLYVDRVMSGDTKDYVEFMINPHQTFFKVFIVLNEKELNEFMVEMYRQLKYAQNTTPREYKHLIDDSVKLCENYFSKKYLP